jgi:hypothetical protein
MKKQQGIRNLRRRLDTLERLIQFQPLPSLLEQIGNLALRGMSDEDLGLMIAMTRDRDAGVSRALLPSELAVLARQDAAHDTEARRMGFKSFADAEERQRR